LAEDAGFDLLVTTDKNVRYQQNLAGRKISIVVLGNSPWWLVRCAATPGSHAEVGIPFKKSCCILEVAR
jgi:hypothetical protein